jgi:ornithine carbamoyltransferase
MPPKRHFLSITDVTPAELRQLVELTVKLDPARRMHVAHGLSLAMVFEKPSLRTRVSMEMAMLDLGGHSIYLSPPEVGLGQREAVKDVAKVLGRYVDIIAARVFDHRTVQELAEHSGVPVVNALSDIEHPCQALADVVTIYETKGRLEGVTVAYVGDANNVATSLALACGALGIKLRMAAPRGFQLTEGFLATLRDYAPDASLELFEDPKDCVRSVDVIYTDVWTSMGQEDEAAARREAFQGYQVNEALLALAAPDAIVMHDLPAHRGEEIADAVIDGPHSVVYKQAENRLHAQKAVLAKLLELEIAG